MALADSIYELFQHPTYELRVNNVLIESWTSLDGTPVRVLSLRGGEAYDEETRIATPPWCEIEVTRIPENMRKGMAVTLDAGYIDAAGNRLLVRIFTGGVWALGEEDPDYLRTQCFGTGATAADGTRIERSASIVGGPAIWPPIPSGQHIDFGIDNHLAHTEAKLEEIVLREARRRARVPKRPYDSKERQTIYCKGDLYGAMRDFKIAARDISGEDVNDALRDILRDSGVASTNINIGAFTLASEGATLDRMPGGGMATPILQLQGGAIRQLPSALVIARVLDEQPAPTAAFRYSNTDQDYARIIRADPPLIAVPFNPLAQIWQTHALDLDYLGIDGRYWVAAHEWEIVPEGGALSYYDYRGGDEFGGTLGIDPVASFTYSVAVQVIGTEPYYVITVIDTSDDPDGEIDQAASTWASNQTTIPDISDFDGETVATIRIAVDDVTGDFEITRHVEDLTGRTDDHTEILDLSASSSAVTVPPFGVAAGTRRIVTPDGAKNVNLTTPSSKTATAVGARLANGINSGHYVFAHSDGSIDVTRDFNKTIAAAFAATGVQINDIKWDWRDQRLVWALSDTCKLYVSTDYAASFFLLHDLRAVTYGGFGGTTVGALGNDIGLPGGGGVYIHGGDGAGRPLIAYNVNPLGGVGNVWIRVTHLGDLLTDLATPADNSMRIVAVAAPGYDGEDIILSWSSGGVGSLVAIYRTTDPPGPARAYTRATGLTAGLKTGRVMMESGPLSPRGRIAAFADRDIWVRPQGSNAWSEINDVLPAGYTPNHGLFMSSVLGGLPNVYEHLLAVENSAGDGGVMKSTDEGDSFNFILGPSTLAGWDTGAKGKKVAVGAPLKTTFSGDGILIISQSGASATAHYLEPGAASWISVALPASIDGPRPLPICITRNNWIVCDVGGFPDSQHGGNAVRTSDGGPNWAAAAIGDVNLGAADPIFGLCDVARAADGRIWGIRKKGNDFGDPIRMNVLYSDDEGATWVNSDSVNNYPFRIACHPSDQNVIAVWGHVSNDSFFRVSIDRGATWVTNNPTLPISDGHATVNDHFLILNNGRFVLCTGDNTATKIYTSDDNGASWTLRHTLTSADRWIILAGAYGAKVVAFTVRQASGGTFDETVLVSDDSAETWSAVGPVLPRTVTTDVGNDWAAKFSGPADELIVHNGNSAGTKRVMRFTPVGPAGVWSDLTLNLATNGEYDSMSLIPRE